MQVLGLYILRSVFILPIPSPYVGFDMSTGLNSITARDKRD